MRLRRRRRAGAAAIVLASLLAPACGGDDAADPGAAATGDGHDSGDDHGHDEASPTASFAPDDADEELTVTLRDYGFVGIPARVTGPNVRFVATVRGSNRHELEVIDAEGESVAVLPPFAAADGERTLEAVLPPGDYTVQCLVKEGTRTHAQLGMRQDLTVA